MMRGAAVALLVLCVGGVWCEHRGRRLGALSELHHGVRGTVYAVDARTLYIHDFFYDGVGPAAYFYVGSSKKVDAKGATRLRDERGSGSPLRKYRGEGVTLSLPDGNTLKDFAWFSVWCDDYAVNFGSVDIPRDLEYPRPARVGALRGVHGVQSDPIVVVDAQTLLVPNFSYDGEAPDAKFWVGRGEKPSPAGIRIPDENGKEAPLRRYDRKTIVLTLPGELTVFDIGHFGVWCEAFTVDFGHVTLPPAALANVPPSLKMLGVSPQTRNAALVGPTTAAPRRRAPTAPLDATTYRPRLRSGPPVRSDSSARRNHLHRRDQTGIYQDSTEEEEEEQENQKKDQGSIESHEYQRQNTQNDQRHQSQAVYTIPQNQHHQNQQYQNLNYQAHINPNLSYLDPEARALLEQQRQYEQQRAALMQELARYQSQYRFLPEQQNDHFSIEGQTLREIHLDEINDQ